MPEISSRRERRLIICADCGEPRPHRAKGMCDRCYNSQRYFAKFGTCPDCGQHRSLVYGGLCKVCWWKKHQRPITCPACGRLAAEHTAGYCRSCYNTVKRSDRVNGRVVRLQPELHRRIRSLSKRSGTTVQAWVNEALQVQLMERRDNASPARTFLNTSRINPLVPNPQEADDSRGGRGSELRGP